MATTPHFVACAWEERREGLQDEPLVSNAELAEAAGLGWAMAAADPGDHHARERLGARYLALVARFHGHALQQILSCDRRAWSQLTQELAVAREQSSIPLDRGRARRPVASLAGADHAARRCGGHDHHAGRPGAPASSALVAVGSATGTNPAPHPTGRTNRSPT